MIYTVLELLSDPYCNHEWTIDVLAESDGIIQPDKLYFTTKMNANKVQIGYQYED